jgi:hypothetical protein
MTFLVQGAVTPDDSVSTVKIQDDAVTLAKMASGTDGNLITYDASGDPAAVATGSSGQVLTSGGAGVAPTFAAGGICAQVVTTQTGAVSSSTDTMPYDDTIPQITEGFELMTLAITPNNSSNILVIETVVQASATGADALSVALFQDTTADALASSTINANQNGRDNFSFKHVMAAGTTSSTTFRVRAGCTTVTTTFNGESGTRRMGGSYASGIVIREYTV